MLLFYILFDILMANKGVNVKGLQRRVKHVTPLNHTDKTWLSGAITSQC